MRRRWLQGFAVGCVSGAALMPGGVLTLLPGAVLWAWAARGPMKLAAGSGGFIGFGVGMLVLLGQAAIRCTIDQSCTQPDLSRWVGIGVGFMILGIGVGMAAGPPSPEPPSPGPPSPQPPAQG